MERILEAPYTKNGRPKHITVIGGGSWGTTIAKLLAEKRYKTTLWVRKEKNANLMNKTHINSNYLPGIELPKNLEITSDIDIAGKDTDLFVGVVPSHAFRDVVTSFKDHIQPTDTFVCASKGLEKGTNKLMTEVVSDVVDTNLAVISGPNHAEEVARKNPSATVISSEDDENMDLLLHVFASPYFRTYGNHDVRGVQLCAAVKNVIAIGTGVADGLGFGDNAKAGIITRGVKEISAFPCLLQQHYSQ